MVAIEQTLQEKINLAPEFFRAHRLLRLQEYYRSSHREDLALVPVSIFWSRAPSKERSLIRVLLSEDWTLTSRFRRLVVILFNRRDITVQFGAPIRFADLDDGTVPANLLTRRIARTLRVAFRNARTALLGPDLSHRRTLAVQITSSRNVRAAIRSEAERTNKTVHTVLRRAQREANEIASDVSYVTIRFFDRILTWFWNRIYDGMEVNGIERVKKLAETSTLVYVPVDPPSGRSELSGETGRRTPRTRTSPGRAGRALAAGRAAQRTNRTMLKRSGTCES